MGTSWTGSPKMDAEKEKELVKEFDALDVSDSCEKGEKEKTRTIAVLPLRAAVDRAELCERQVRDILPDVGIVGIARRLWSGGGRGYSS